MEPNSPRPADGRRPAASDPTLRQAGRPLGSQRYPPAPPRTRRATGTGRATFRGSNASARPLASTAVAGSGDGSGRRTNRVFQGRFIMSTVKLVDERTDNPKVRAVFEDIKATKKIDRVPNIWRALATHPEHLERCWTRLKAIMRPGKIDLLTKEIIALAISVTNGCPY